MLMNAHILIICLLTRQNEVHDTNKRTGVCVFIPDLALINLIIDFYFGLLVSISTWFV